MSGLMTNAPLMLNVDCDMFVNNPKIFVMAMCAFIGLKPQERAFVQFPQDFYNKLKHDPFGNQTTAAIEVSTYFSNLVGIICKEKIPYIIIYGVLLKCHVLSWVFLRIWLLYMLFKVSQRCILFWCSFIYIYWNVLNTLFYNKLSI